MHAGDACTMQYLILQGIIDYELPRDICDTSRFAVSRRFCIPYVNMYQISMKHIQIQKHHLRQDTTIYLGNQLSIHLPRCSRMP